jgi:hypothetical protein
MIERPGVEARRGLGDPDPQRLTSAQVHGWVETVQRVDREADDAERIDLLRALEVLKCAAEAAQAVVTADFDRSQQALAEQRGVPVERRGRGIAEQVAMARRESPHRARQHLSFARIAERELPHTHRALVEGRVTQWRMLQVAEATACLELRHRAEIDAQLAAVPERFEAMSDREALGEVRRLACQLDPAAIVARRRRAESERRVSVRPAPDVMSQFSALLPAAQGVAVFAALKTEADRQVAAGDGRNRGQIMADTLVERVTGQARADATPVHAVVVVPDTVLLGTREEAAELDGYGPIPAELARELVLGSPEHATLRRLYATPTTGQVVGMDSRARAFPEGLATLIRLRDRTCRTPWCDAPVRHIDHIEEHATGGGTSERNGQGTCESCNHAKQADGWRFQIRPGPRHEIELVTPTGHRYRARAPATRPVGHPSHRLDFKFASLVYVAA